MNVEWITLITAGKCSTGNCSEIVFQWTNTQTRNQNISCITAAYFTTCLVCDSIVLDALPAIHRWLKGNSGCNSILCLIESCDWSYVRGTWLTCTTKQILRLIYCSSAIKPYSICTYKTRKHTNAMWSYRIGWPAQAGKGGCRLNSEDKKC